MPEIEIPYTPLSYQIGFHRDRARFKVVVGGRRVGKSLSCLNECIAKCLEDRNRLVYWVAPTYRDAREVGWAMLDEYLDVLSPAISFINITNLTIGFTNHSKLCFKSGEKERSLRGRALHHVVMDEAAFINQDIWSKALRPALSDTQGTAVLISTPNGRNWFFDKYNEAIKDSKKVKNQWNAFLWPTEINPYILPSEISLARSELSDIDFRQEYMAEFITQAGMVYENFGEANILETFTLNEHMDIYLGMDFGFANPSAIVFVAVDNRTGKVYQFDELYVSRTPIARITEMIREKLTKWGLDKTKVKTLYTDPAGNAEELTSGESPVDYLRMEGGYEVINKASRILYGISMVRSFIRSADGTIRYFILKDCVDTIRSLQGYAYVKKKNTETINEEPDKDGVNDHACDALRYFFVNKFDKSKWVSNRMVSNNYLKDDKMKSVCMKKCSNCRKPFVSRTPKDEPPFVCKDCLSKEI